MTLRACLTVLSLLLGPAAAAQDPSEAASPRPEFVALDRNRDG